MGVPLAAFFVLIMCVSAWGAFRVRKTYHALCQAVELEVRVSMLHSEMCGRMDWSHELGRLKDHPEEYKATFALYTECENHNVTRQINVLDTCAARTFEHVADSLRFEEWCANDCVYVSRRMFDSMIFWVGPLLFASLVAVICIAKWCVSPYLAHRSLAIATPPTQHAPMDENTEQKRTSPTTTAPYPDLEGGATTLGDVDEEDEEEDDDAESESESESESEEPDSEPPKKKKGKKNNHASELINLERVLMQRALANKYGKSKTKQL
jgi:hypothetical protein